MGGLKLGHERTVDERVNQHFGEYGSHRRQPLGDAILSLLQRDQMRLLRLCTALETIADGLPGSGSQQRTAKVLAFLDKAFARHLFIYEKCLFPMIRSLEEKNEPLELILQELEFEHAADRGLIVEIASAFMGRHERNGELNSQMLGYLLRAFFENCRRHCAWERNIVLPIIQQHLFGGTPRKQHDALLRLSVGLNEKRGSPKAAVLC